MDTIDKNTAANIVLAIGGLNGFVSTEVQNSTSVIRLNGSAKIPPIANTRHVSGYGRTTHTTQTKSNNQDDTKWTSQH